MYGRDSRITVVNVVDEPSRGKICQRIVRRALVTMS